MQIAECFSKVADLAGVLGVTKINRLPGLWVHKVDDEWQVSANGHGETIDQVPPYSIRIENLKYLSIGIVNPSGGMIVGGQEAEDAFIEAVDRAIERAKVKVDA